MTSNMLTPVLALISWTFVIWGWMYATRIPAMQRAGLNPRRIKRKDELDVLPVAVKQIADNYNHLHEQPTIFYALMFFAAMTGGADGFALRLAWIYVVLRVVHSLVQATVNKVLVRFLVFSAATIALLVFTVRELARVF